MFSSSSSHLGVIDGARLFRRSARVSPLSISLLLRSHLSPPKHTHIFFPHLAGNSLLCFCIFAPALQAWRFYSPHGVCVSPRFFERASVLKATLSPTNSFQTFTHLVKRGGDATERALPRPLVRAAAPTHPSSGGGFKCARRPQIGTGTSCTHALFDPHSMLLFQMHHM